jgi:hypothetical protein
MNDAAHTTGLARGARDKNGVRHQINLAIQATVPSS